MCRPGQIVDNKRLGAVLKLAQDKMDELERDGKRDRSKKMPKKAGTGPGAGTSKSYQSGAGKPSGIQGQPETLVPCSFLAYVANLTTAM